nr:immunoglobulin light chain junction region [Macaca mulatta]MPN93304.1 immunoglobulin light chain junction region [Macaca mulatta]
CQKYRSSPYSF